MEQDNSSNMNVWKLHGFIGFSEEILKDNPLLPEIIKRLVYFSRDVFGAFSPFLTFEGSKRSSLQIEKLLSLNEQRFKEILTHAESITISASSRADLSPKNGHEWRNTLVLNIHLDFGYNQLIPNPWFSLYCFPLHMELDAQLAIQQIVLSLMSDIFSSLAGLSGYIDPFLDPCLEYTDIFPITSYERSWMERLCGYADVDRLSALNLTKHASQWIRGVGWGIFLSSSLANKAMEGDHKNAEQFFAAKGLDAIPLNQASGYFIRLLANSVNVNAEDMSIIRSAVVRVLPEQYLTDCQLFTTYLDDIFQGNIERLDMATPADTRAETGVIHHWHELRLPRTERPLFIGEIQSSDYSELENISFLFQGELTEDQRARIQLYIRSWIEDALENYDSDQALFCVKYSSITNPIWTTMKRDAILASLTGQHATKIKTKNISTINFDIEFGYCGETSLKYIVRVADACARVVNATLVACLFGSFTNI